MSRPRKALLQQIARGAVPIGLAVGLTGCAASGDLVAYEGLTPEASTYTLALNNGGATTQWTYTSEHVDETTSARPCTGTALAAAGENVPEGGECRPEPLIFLKYDLGLTLDETVPAGSHAIGVTAYYEEQITTPPEVTDLTAEISYDSGETWASVEVEDSEGDTFALQLQHPDDADAVTLRITAEDSDGNTVVQTLSDAFTVS